MGINGLLYVPVLYWRVKKFGVLQKAAGRSREEKNLLPLPAVERRFLDYNPIAEQLLGSRPIRNTPNLRKWKMFAFFVATPYLRKDFLTVRPSRISLRSVHSQSYRIY
jgi:hypothetical protein